MPEEDWTNNLNAVISKMEEKDKTLGQETRRFWNEITTHAYIFDRAELTMNILKEDVTRAKLLAFFDEKLRVGGRMRRYRATHHTHTHTCARVRVRWSPSLMCVR
jgi:secreted Zn-dependent insulinase-like peptidase